MSLWERFKMAVLIVALVNILNFVIGLYLHKKDVEKQMAQPQLSYEISESNYNKRIRDVTHSKTSSRREFKVPHVITTDRDGKPSPLYVRQGYKKPTS